MGRNTVFSVLLLALIWLILRESFSLIDIATGIIAGACCFYIYIRFLPFSKMEKINLFRLAAYPFYLIWQVYSAGFGAIKLVFTDADAGVVEIKTRLSNVMLRTILANSITLIPGSISLGLNDDKISVLWLTKKTGGRLDAENAALTIKSKLERMLLRIQG